MHLQIRREEGDMTWLTAKFCALLWHFVWLPLWDFSSVKQIDQPGGTCFGLVFVGCCGNSESSFSSNDSSGVAMCGRELAVPLLLGRIKGRKLREGWAQDSPFLPLGGCLEPPAWGALGGNQLWVLVMPRAFRQLESDPSNTRSWGSAGSKPTGVCIQERERHSLQVSPEKWDTSHHSTGVSAHCPVQGP